MRYRNTRAVGFEFLTFLFIACGVATAAQAAVSTEKRFIENLGQWDPTVRYHMFAGQAAEDPPRRLELWLTDRGYVYHLIETTRPDTAPTDSTVVPPASAPQPAVADVSEHAVAVSFTGASEPAIEAQNPMPGTFNWLVGERASHLSGAESYQRL